MGIPSKWNPLNNSIDKLHPSNNINNLVSLFSPTSLFRLPSPPLSLSLSIHQTHTGQQPLPNLTIPLLPTTTYHRNLAQPLKLSHHHHHWNTTKPKNKKPPPNHPTKTTITTETQPNHRNLPITTTTETPPNWTNHHHWN